MQVLQLSAYYMIFHAQICQTIRKNIFKNIPGIWGAQGQKYSRYSPRGGVSDTPCQKYSKTFQKNIPKKIFQHLRGIPGIFKIGAPHVDVGVCVSVDVDVVVCSFVFFCLFLFLFVVAVVAVVAVVVVVVVVVAVVFSNVLYDSVCFDMF